MERCLLVSSPTSTVYSTIQDRSSLLVRPCHRHLDLGHETLVLMLEVPPSFKKGAMTSHPVGVRMVDLPRGNVIEERRGGAGILATLVNEMIDQTRNKWLREN